MQLRAGDTIDGCLLIEPLGRGGQGSVWKVTDVRTGAPLALKLFDRDRSDAMTIARARREAAALASASHPAVVRCHRFFEDSGSGLAGLVLERIEGDPLSTALFDPRMTASHRFAILAPLANGLAHVHGAGVAHRDLKPANVMLAEAFWKTPNALGAVKLVDFGIAAAHGNPHPLTQEGAVMGTTRYLPPELVDPALWRGGEQGFARDLFAFGVVAFEVLRGGGHPTGLGPAATVPDFARAYAAASVGRLPWPPPGLDGAWGAVLAECLSLRASGRPSSGIALLERIRVGAAPRSRRSAPEIETALHTPPLAPICEPQGRAKGASRRFAIAIGVIASGAVALGMRWGFDAGAAHPPDVPSPVAPPSSTALPPRSNVPVPAQPPEKPCCGGVKCTPGGANLAPGVSCTKGEASCRACASGRDIVPFECDEFIPPTKKFRLRVGGVAERREGSVIDMATLADRKDASVCFTFSSVPRCVDLATIQGTPGGLDTGLDVTLEDLTRCRLEVKQGATVLGSRTHALKSTRVGTAALCVGVSLKGFSGVVSLVNIFLGDDDQ